MAPGEYFYRESKHAKPEKGLSCMGGRRGEQRAGMPFTPPAIMAPSPRPSYVHTHTSQCNTNVQCPSLVAFKADVHNSDSSGDIAAYPYSKAQF